MTAPLAKQTSITSAAQSSTMSISLIGKLQSLEEIIQQMTSEMNAVNREVQQMRGEKEGLGTEMTHRCLDGKDLLDMEVRKTESEMRRHMSNQKAENNRLLMQVNQLKNEKAALETQIAKLRGRVQGLEQLIGEEVQAK